MGRHKEWRKTAKKMRRKRVRSAAAVIRDEEERKRSVEISHCQTETDEQLFRENEAKRASLLAHEKWLYVESLAQERWAKQEKLRLEEEQRRQDEMELMMRKREKEQETEQLAKEEQEREDNEKRLHYEEVLREMDGFIAGSGLKPEALNGVTESNPGKAVCPFFSKVAACRFKESCNRNHVRPGVSRVILIPGFYSHFSLEIGTQGEYDTDINLEFDNAERYHHFKEFFVDIVPELEQFGRVVQLRVCSNTEHHLRGNVYVGYKDEREAAAAFRALNGRFYAGRRLNVEFVNVPVWKNAICGLQFRGKCPKGSKCNFLHVFRNPNNLYSAFEATTPIRETSQERSSQWQWSPSPPPEEEPARRPRSKTRRRHRESRRNESRRRSRRRSGEGDERRRSRRARSRSTTAEGRRKKRAARETSSPTIRTTKTNKN